MCVCVCVCVCVSECVNEGVVCEYALMVRVNVVSVVRECV